MLQTVLKHLPILESSEGDMEIHVIQNAGDNYSSSTDEFGMRTNNWYNMYGEKSINGALRIQRTYSILVKAAFRHTEISECYRQFQNWLCRFAKRVPITQCLVKISSYDKVEIIDNSTPYRDMYELPAYSRDNTTGEPNWCDYLLWDYVRGFELPMLLAYKYFADKENDTEVERRRTYYKQNSD